MYSGNQVDEHYRVDVGVLLIEPSWIVQRDQFWLGCAGVPRPGPGLSDAGARGGRPPKVSWSVGLILGSGATTSGVAIFARKTSITADECSFTMKLETYAFEDVATE